MTKPRQIKPLVPPTLDEVKEFWASKPKFSGFDPVDFFEFYECGDWIDSKGNPVLNWKQKMFTWARYNPPVARKDPDAWMKKVQE